MVILDFIYYLLIFLFNLIITLPGLIYYSGRKLLYLSNLPSPNKIPLDGIHDWVILVHGHNGFPQEFDSLAAAIKKKYLNRAILCINLGKNTDTSIHSQIEMMHKILESYDHLIGNMKIMGLSMGGVIAMLYAKKYPKNVTSVITVSSPVGGTKISTYNPIFPTVRKELGYQSKDLDVLQNEPNTYQVYHIVPWWDHLIRPMDSAQTKYGISYYYKGFKSHSGILEDQNVIKQIVKWINN